MWVPKHVGGNFMHLWYIFSIACGIAFISWLKTLHVQTHQQFTSTVVTRTVNSRKRKIVFVFKWICSWLHRALNFIASLDTPDSVLPKRDSRCSVTEVVYTCSTWAVSVLRLWTEIYGTASYPGDCWCLGQHSQPLTLLIPKMWSFCGKVKINVSVCLIKHCIVKQYLVNGGIAPCFVKPGTGWTWMVRFTNWLT
jgi:hypothetical protein